MLKNIIVPALAFLLLLVGYVSCSISPHEPMTDAGNVIEQNRQKSNAEDGNENNIEYPTDKIVEYLIEYGFLNDTGAGFEYNKGVTRLDAVVMIVRLNNCEDYALTNEWGSDNTIAHEYTDVPDWGSPYVSCALTIGILKDNETSLFGSDLNVTASEFVTFLLRALGYNDSYGHFDPDTPWRLSDHIGLTNGTYYTNSTNFTFEDMVRLSFIALCTNLKNNSQSMYCYYFVYKRPSDTIEPEIFQERKIDNLCIDKWDSYKEATVGEIRSGSITYCGEQVELSFCVSDTSIVSFEFIEFYTDGGHSITQNFQITGKEEGCATIEITFSEGYGDPRAIAFVDVYVK